MWGFVILVEILIYNHYKVTQPVSTFYVIPCKCKKNIPFLNHLVTVLKLGIQWHEFKIKRH